MIIKLYKVEITCKIFSYNSVKNILEGNLDSEAIEDSITRKIIQLPNYRFARNSADYKSSAHNYKNETFDERIEKWHSSSKFGNAMAGGFNALSADQVMKEYEN